MAIKISELPVEGNEYDGDELVALVQDPRGSAVTSRSSLSSIAGYLSGAVTTGGVNPLVSPNKVNFFNCDQCFNNDVTVLHDLSGGGKLIIGDDNTVVGSPTNVSVLGGQGHCIGGTYNTIGGGSGNALQSCSFLIYCWLTHLFLVFLCPRQYHHLTREY